MLVSKLLVIQQDTEQHAVQLLKQLNSRPPILKSAESSHQMERDMQAIINNSPNPLQQLSEYGQSVWLDYIQRSLIRNGALDRLIEQDGLR
jgi:hypothetical protein